MFIVILVSLILQLSASQDKVPGYRPSVSHKSETKCFIAQNALIGNQNIVSDLDSWKTDSELLRHLNIPEWIVSFSNEPDMIYLRGVQADDFSLTYHIYMKISRWVEYSYDYADSILTDYASKLLKAQNKRMFLTMCGDSLISSYEEGAILIITVKLNFQSILDKIRFLESKKPPAFLNDTLLQSQYPGLQVMISAFQIGGDPLALPIPTTKCDLSNIGQCSKSLKRVITYARETFSKQLSTSNIPWENQFVRLRGIIQGPYLTDIGYELPSDISSEAFEEGRSLLKEYKKLVQIKAGFEKLLETGMILEVASRNLEIVLGNLEILQRGGVYKPAIYCWLNPNSCEKLAKDIRKSLKEIEFVPQATKICVSPKDAGLEFKNACAGLKGIYINFEWKSGNWMETGLPNEKGYCVASAVGNQKTLDGIIPFPCETQMYLPINIFMQKSI